MPPSCQQTSHAHFKQQRRLRWLFILHGRRAPAPPGRSERLIGSAGSRLLMLELMAPSAPCTTDVFLPRLAMVAIMPWKGCGCYCGSGSGMRG